MVNWCNMIETVHVKMQWLRVVFSLVFHTNSLLCAPIKLQCVQKIGNPGRKKGECDLMNGKNDENPCNAIVLIWKPLDNNKYVFIHTKFVLCVFIVFVAFVVVFFNLIYTKFKRSIVVIVRLFFFVVVVGFFKQQNQISEENGKTNTLMNKQIPGKIVVVLLVVVVQTL